MSVLVDGMGGLAGHSFQGGLAGGSSVDPHYTICVSPDSPTFTASHHQTLISGAAGHPADGRRKVPVEVRCLLEGVGCLRWWDFIFLA